MKHYTEVELLEQYYLGNVSAGLAEHVNSCRECMARFRRLAEKLSCPAEAHRERVDTKPDSFWSRQRSEIAAKIQSPRRLPTSSRVWRLAAAAVVALGLVIFVSTDDPAPAPNVVQAPVATPQGVAASLDEEAALNPWESEELQPYSDVVGWEAWLAEEKS